MRYYAKPIEVEAYVIMQTSPFLFRGDLHVETEDGRVRCATAAMIARFHPTCGDVWVIQQDGYEYVCPRGVFDRKYSMRPPAFDVEVKISPCVEEEEACRAASDSELEKRAHTSGIGVLTGIGRSMEKLMACAGANAPSQGPTIGINRDTTSW